MDPLAGSGLKFDENGNVVPEDCDTPAAVTPVFATTEAGSPAQYQ